MLKFMFNLTRLFSICVWLFSMKGDNNAIHNCICDFNLHRTTMQLGWGVR